MNTTIWRLSFLVFCTLQVCHMRMVMGDNSAPKREASVQKKQKPKKCLLSWTRAPALIILITIAMGWLIAASQASCHSPKHKSTRQKKEGYTPFWYQDSTCSSYHRHHHKPPVYYDQQYPPISKDKKREFLQALAEIVRKDSLYQQAFKLDKESSATLKRAMEGHDWRYMIPIKDYKQILQNFIKWGKTHPFILAIGYGTALVQERDGKIEHYVTSASKRGDLILRPPGPEEQNDGGIMPWDWKKTTLNNSKVISHRYDYGNRLDEKEDRGAEKGINMGCIHYILDTMIFAKIDYFILTQGSYNSLGLSEQLEPSWLKNENQGEAFQFYIENTIDAARVIVEKLKEKRKEMPQIVALFHITC